MDEKFIKVICKKKNNLKFQKIQSDNDQRALMKLAYKDPGIQITSASYQNIIQAKDFNPLHK